jgi:hypothetical protein
MPAMRLFGSAYAAIALSIPALDLALSDPQIPVQFQGLWQITNEHQPPTCLEIDSDIRMTVRDSRVDSHEGLCTVQSAEPQDEKTVLLKSECAEEGTIWNSEQEWTHESRGQDTFLTIRVLNVPKPYKVFYGLCPSANAAMERFAPNQALCYRDGMSKLTLQPTENGDGDIELEATFNQHICWISGPVTKIGDGYLYMSTVEDGTQCELSIELADDGSITLLDKDQNCRNFHCGARATFEDITIPASARRQCQ